MLLSYGINGIALFKIRSKIAGRGFVKTESGITSKTYGAGFGGYKTSNRSERLGLRICNLVKQPHRLTCLQMYEPLMKVLPPMLLGYCTSGIAYLLKG